MVVGVATGVFVIVTVGVAVGTRFGQRLSTAALKRIFAYYLVALALRMAARALL